MGSSKPLSFTQKIVATRQSSISGVEQRLEVSLSQQVYFNLEIAEAPNIDPFANVSAASEVDLHQFEAGGTYTVRVSASVNGHSGQQPFIIQSPIEVCLLCWCQKPLDETVSIANPYRTVPHKSVETFVETFTEEFQITVARECPTADLELQLFYREGHSSQWRKLPVALLKLSLRGTYNPVDEGFMETCKVELDTPLLDKFAILHIETPTQGKLRLSSWSYRGRPFYTDSAQPSIGLAAFVEGKIAPEDLRNEVRKFSRQSPEKLLRWLQELLKRYPEQLCLIIVDDTNSEFPWEMMQLDDKTYLGASAIVVRWVGVQCYGEWQKLHICTQQYSGSVLAYLEEAGLTHTLEERQVLDTLITTYCQTTKELTLQLAQTLNTVGLVYLGCYGIFTHSIEHKTAVASLHNPSEQVVHIPLESVETRKGSRPVFFVNASHSARLFGSSDRRCGLPEVLLARIADGYIGTLGSVGPKYAVETAQRILSAAHQHTDIQLAEVLRRLRAQAVRKIDINHTSKDDWHRFIYTFMYVYYGNPLARLRLTCSEATRVSI